MKTKLLKMFILAIVLIMAFFTKVEASIFDGADEFMNVASGAGSAGVDATKDAVNEVGAMLVSIAGYILVIGVIVVGMKYMTANPEGKAKLKGQLIGLAVATFVIFGAQWLWSTIISLFPD